MLPQTRFPQTTAIRQTKLNTETGIIKLQFSTKI